MIFYLEKSFNRNLFATAVEIQTEGPVPFSTYKQRSHPIELTNIEK